MTFPPIERTRRQLSQLLKRTKASDRFLQQARGVIHVGANIGQERNLYWKHGLAVLWIEPIPEVFAILQENIQGYPKQQALQALVTHADSVDYQFYVANNRGESSSILPMHLHKEIWPDVAYEKTITLQSRTLALLLQDEQIDPGQFDVLTMDTQGSELLVLQGAESILPNFKYIRTEAPDFEAYKGCCLISDLTEHLAARGYREISRDPFARSKHGRSYYDVVYGK